MTTNPCLSCVKGSLVKVTWRDGYQLATGLQPVEDASRQQAFVTSKWKRTNHSGQPHHPNHCQLFGWKYSAQIQPRWSLFDLWIRSFFLAKSRQTFLFCFSCPARHCLSFTKWEEEEEEEMWSHLRTGQLTNFLCECFEKDPLERLELEFFSSHNQLSPPHSNFPSNQAYRQIDSILLCKDLQEKAPNYLKPQLSTAVRIHKLRLHRDIILPSR